MSFDFGLESLAAELESDTTGVSELPIEQVQADAEQPRTVFDIEKLERLADSIQAQGVIQPIIVRVADAPDSYIIIAGERRWRAAKMAGLTTIPAIIRESNYAEVVAAQIIENIDREGFTLFDEVKAVVRMCDLCGSAKEAADALGKTKAWVSQRVKIAKGGELVETFINAGGSSDVVGTYQLARLVERDTAVAQQFIQTWIEQPDTRGNLRKKVAELFAELDAAKAQPATAAQTNTNAHSSVESSSVVSNASQDNPTAQTKTKNDSSVTQGQGKPEAVVDFEIQGDNILLKTDNKTIVINEALFRVIHDQL